MKIAVTGKGGVGKTTVSSVLARLFAAENRKILAVDVDPDANLGLALGFTEEELAEITPISKMRALIEERTGASSDTMGKFFKINPRVDDIPERFAKEHDGVKLLVMGTVETGGGGCVCPEHVILKRVISHLLLQDDDVVVMDMEAGLEHLGRGTTDFMDKFIVVVEPGARSIQTFEKIRQLARDLGITRIGVIANKIRTEEDEEFIRQRIPEDVLLGFIHYNPDIMTADQKGQSPFDVCPEVIDEIKKIKERIEGIA